MRVGAGRANGEERWYGANVYYFAEPKEDLLLDAVKPFLDEVAGFTRCRYFARHWLRGPHIRLRCLCTSQVFSELVVPVLDERIRGYLSANPSSAVVDGEKMLPQYEELARYEREDGPLLPLFPDNSVVFPSPDRRDAVLGEALTALIEEFYGDTNDLVFAMLDHIRRGGSRLTLSLDLMFATALASGEPITRSFISYRSHAEAFILASTDPTQTRARLEERYRARAEVLRTRLEAVLQSIAAGEERAPFSLRWHAVMSEFRRRANELVESGALDGSGFGFGPRPNVTFGGQLAANLRHSEFHSEFAKDPSRLHAAYRDPWFQGYRLILNLTYLHMTRLGVSPVDRFLLCHLAANTVEDAFGVSATELIGARRTRR